MSELFPRDAGADQIVGLGQAREQEHAGDVEPEREGDQRLEAVDELRETGVDTRGARRQGQRQAAGRHGVLSLRNAD
jgi:IS5 family transposase